MSYVLTYLDEFGKLKVLFFNRDFTVGQTGDCTILTRWIGQVYWPAFNWQFFWEKKKFSWQPSKNNVAAEGKF